jgi:integrase
MPLAAAREQCRRAIQEAQLGRNPAATVGPRRDVSNIGDLCELFIARELPKLAESTQKEWARLIKVEIKPALGGVDPRDVRGCRAAVRETGEEIAERAPYTSNRVYEVVRRIISWAVEQDLIDPSPVFMGLPKPAQEKVRDRVLTPEEIRSVFGALYREPPITSIFWKLAFYTGQRRGEVLGARWDAFDLEEGLWRFRTKGDKPHVLPLSTQATGILKEAYLLSSHTPFVCPGPSRAAAMWNPQKAAGRVRERSRVQFRIHDIRRTVATGLAELGVEEGIISRVLNHSISAGGGARITAQVYNQYAYLPPMRGALQAWGDRLDDIVRAEIKDRLISMPATGRNRRGRPRRPAPLSIALKA